jgi:hypothetical protein
MPLPEEMEDSVGFGGIDMRVFLDFCGWADASCPTGQVACGGDPEWDDCMGGALRQPLCIVSGISYLEDCRRVAAAACVFSLILNF